jgi:rhodanese-related sulfurtransferase
MKYIYLLPLMFVFSCGEATEETVSETTEEEVEEVITNEEGSELEPQMVRDLENEEFNSLLAETNGFLLDVRTPEEFEAGNIEGSVNINFYDENFEEQLDSLDTMTPVFVYCKAGGRSAQARDILVEKDFIEVYNLSGGFSNWSK